MRITARVDYAVRAALELAAVAPEALTSERIAVAQGIPARFLQAILRDLQHSRLVSSQRGREGGYRLALPAAEHQLVDDDAQHARQPGLPVDLLVDQRAGAGGGEPPRVRHPPPADPPGVHVTVGPHRHDLAQGAPPGAAERACHVERDGQRRLHQRGETQLEHGATLADPAGWTLQDSAG